MKKYLLIFSFFILSFTSCSRIQEDQTKVNSSTTSSNQVNNQINKVSSENLIAGENSKQRFNPAKVVHFSTGETHLKTGSSTEAILTLKIDSPYHVNSNPPSEKNFIPLEVNFESANGITDGKPVYPKGKAKTFAFSEKPLSIYSDEVVVKLPLKTNSAIAKGEQTLDGKLRFQACDEEVCYPPQNVNIRLPIIID